MWYGHGWWMGLWWVVVLGGIVLAIWLATRSAARSHDTASAEEVLRRRFANGELDESEYRQRLAVLKE